MAFLFVPTNSVDGTCDSLVREFAERNIGFLRWNIDLWQSYEIVATPGRMTVTDPTGRSVDLTAPDVFLLWRKPFTDLMTFDASLGEADQEQARTQMDQWLHAVVAFMLSQGRIRLVEPYADRRLPKLFQLIEARQFLEVPESLFSILSSPADFGPMLITKPLGNPEVGKGNILYTNCVNTKELYRPYPWFVQKALVEGTDVTCVHILGRNYFYECDFGRAEGAIDWRTEINTETQSGWHKLDHPELDSLSDGVSALMHRLHLHYGRLDFIRQKDKLFFLECNTNGQFGWLDDPKTCHLHSQFVDAALSQESRVE
jgi:hypothetical protein